MKNLFTTASSLLLGLALCSAASAQTVEKKSLTLDGAKKAIAAAVAEARSKNAPGAAIAVVDEGGILVALERLDSTFPAKSSPTAACSRSKKDSSNSSAPI